MRPVALLPLALGLSLFAPFLCAEAPLTLDEALRSAAARNPRLAAQAQSQAAARARVAQSRWDQWGRLDLTAQWAPSLKNPSFELPSLAPGWSAQRFDLQLQQNHQFTLSAEQPLWTWGSLAGRRRAAEVQVEAEDAGLQREDQQLRFDVTRAFLEARQAEALVGVAEAAVRQQAAFLDTAQARVRSGQAPRLDVLKAELALSRADSDLVARRNAVRTMREELVTFTEDARFRSSPLAPVAELPLPGAAEAELLAEARRRRPDLKALQRGAQALGLEAAANRASGLPTLALVGNLSQQKDTLNGVFQNENRTYLVGVALRWEALGSQRARARGAEREAQARQRLSQVQGLEARIALEVRTARYQVEDAQAQVTLAATALRQAEEQVRVARLAYREGVSTAVEAQDAELALSRARTQALNAGLDRELALARLNLALGKP